MIEGVCVCAAWRCGRALRAKPRDFATQSYGKRITRRRDGRREALFGLRPAERRPLWEKKKDNFLCAPIVNVLLIPPSPLCVCFCLCARVRACVGACVHVCVCVSVSVRLGEGEWRGRHGNGAQQEGGQAQRGGGHAAAARLQGLGAAPRRPRRGDPPPHTHTTSGHSPTVVKVDI